MDMVELGGALNVHTIDRSTTEEKKWNEKLRGSAWRTSEGSEDTEAGTEEEDEVEAPLKPNATKCVAFWILDYYGNWNG